MTKRKTVDTDALKAAGLYEKYAKENISKVIKSIDTLSKKNQKLITEILKENSKFRSINMLYNEAKNLLLDIGFIQDGEKFSLPDGKFSKKHTGISNNYIKIRKSGKELNGNTKIEICKICQELYGKNT